MAGLEAMKMRALRGEGASWFTDCIPGDDYLWTSGFVNERFSEPVSPLGWSSVRELLEELAFREALRYMGYPRADSLPVTKLYRGHPFVNGTVFGILYKPFPEFLLPEDAYRYFPGGDTNLRKRASYPPSILAPRFLFSILRAFLRDPQNWSPWHNYRQWARFTTQHRAEMAAIAERIEGLRKATSGVSLGEIWAVIKQAQGLNKRLLALHRWSLTHADLLYSLLRRLMAAWLGEEKGTGLSAKLVLGLPNKSLELDRELQKLAEVSSGELYEISLAAFLAHYGHRSFSLDIYRPTFSADPTQVRELIGGLKKGKSELVTEDAVRKRDNACKQVREALTKASYLSPIKWSLNRMKLALLNHLLILVQRYMPLREDQRFYWQKGLAAIRELFLMIGDRLAAHGLLKDREEVFFATKDDIEDYVRERKAFPAHLVQSRQREFKQLQEEHRRAPHLAYPAFLVGNRPLKVSQRSEQLLVGRPISPGIKIGPVRVVEHPGQFSKVRAGDIMVAKTIDPGWTPIFGKLGGLIMETGGQLSHGAVVAREYGLPAIAGIAGATQRLHDGQVVLLDGSSGRAEVIA
jgi:phosphohistidine swiveling domain-containing protein